MPGRNNMYIVHTHIVHVWNAIALLHDVCNALHIHIFVLNVARTLEFIIMLCDFSPCRSFIFSPAGKTVNNLSTMRNIRLLFQFSPRSDVCIAYNETRQQQKNAGNWNEEPTAEDICNKKEILRFLSYFLCSFFCVHFLRWNKTKKLWRIYFIISSVLRSVRRLQWQRWCGSC